ncbi:hypothetical protein HKD37_10G028093 [Glycine soja]|nr:hypothetical protein GmHk_10G028697 [Glycine max]
MKTWEEVVEKFMKKYFPESNTVEGKVVISSFHKFPDESLSEALERFWGLLRKTHTHGFSKLIQLNMFIDGLRRQTKQSLDASAGGKIKLKTPEEETELIENMSASDHAILLDRVHQPTKKSLLELSSQDALLAQNKFLSKQLEILTKTLGKLPTKLSTGQPSYSSVLQVTGCTICGKAHESSHCIPIEEHTREVHYMGNQQRQGYNQGGFSEFQQGPYNQQGQWRSHPGNQFNKDQGGPSNRSHQQGPNIFQRTTKLEETLAQFMQVGEMAKQLAKKSSSSFGANTEKNPKEECKVVITRSRKLVAAEDEDVVSLKEQVALKDTTDKKKNEIYHTEFDEFKAELERQNLHKRLANLQDGSIDVAMVKDFYANLYTIEDQSPKQVKTSSVFSYSNLAPTSHTSNLNMDRARLVYDLVTNMDMDIGALISGQISSIAQINFRGARKARVRLVDVPSSSTLPAPCTSATPTPVPPGSSTQDSQRFESML